MHGIVGSKLTNCNRLSPSKLLALFAAQGQQGNETMFYSRMKWLTYRKKEIGQPLWVDPWKYIRKI